MIPLPLIVSVLGGGGAAAPYDFASIPALTIFFDPPEDANVTTDGGAVTALTSTGAAGAAAAGTATYRTTGCGGRPCIEGNGTTDTFDWDKPLSDLLSGDDFYLAVVVHILAVTTNSANVYENDRAVGSASITWGVHFQSDGTVRSLFFDQTAYRSTSLSIPQAEAALVTMRLKSGRLYLGVNGAEDAGIACDPLHSFWQTFALRMMRGGAAGSDTIYTNVRIGRFLMCDADPGATIRGEIEDALVAFYGITP